MGCDTAGFRAFLEGKVPAVKECMARPMRTDKTWALQALPNRIDALHALAGEISTACGAAHVGGADPWITAYAARVPHIIRGIGDNLELTMRKVSDGELKAEVEKALGNPIVAVRWTGDDNPDTRYRDVLIQYRQALRAAFSVSLILFDETTKVTVRTTSRRLQQCRRC